MKSPIANRPRRVPTAALAIGVGLTVCGFTVQPMTPAQQALVNHYTNNDPAWALLRKTTTGEDRAKGLLTATFPPEISALSGRSFRISGFMTPLETSSLTRHFIVTRRSTTCPFCPPNEPTEAVEVKLDAPMTFTTEEITVAGRMALVASSDEGLFYRLISAALVPRSTSKKFARLSYRGILRGFGLSFPKQFAAP